MATTHASSAQHINGVQSPTAEAEQLYDQLLRLRDAVVAGTHPHLKLPPAAIESLKAQRRAPTAGGEQPAVNGVLSNGFAYNANAATTNTQHSSTATFPGLPGLQAPSRSLVNNAVPPPMKPTSSGTLDPIFLEKSDSLVRAEGQLKRQRIERELQTQVEHRRLLHRDRDPAGDAPVALDVEAILASASAHEPHVSGLEQAKAATRSRSSSFDTNDYYSSQVESDWSSPQSASKRSDRATGVFPADVEPREAPNGPSASHAKTSAAAQSGQSAKGPTVHVNSFQFGGMFEVDDDDDDEYDPADTTAFGSATNGTTAVVGGQITPPDDEDEDSEYEPGEITQESAVLTPYDQGYQPAQPSPQVPVIRNHLTHIAAPQPNRVSPLAVAKRSSHELELVNGRPEVVHRGRPNHHAAQSRASTGSPPNGIGGSGKKRQKKKRKRDQETSNRNTKKSRRERHAAAQSPPSPAHAQPYIKDEPISPPPSFANVPEVQSYGQRATQYRPAEIDLVSPRHGPPQVQYAHEAPRSGLRYEYAAPASPAAVRVASPAYRPVHRDTQDLRRVASLHYAQRPSSPTQRTYSPAPTRTASMTYGDPRLAKAMEADPYQDPTPREVARYVRTERSRSPPRLQEYHDPYARVSSPAMMPPPAAPPRRIVMDQYGNRYYAAEPIPTPQQPPPRASVAPVDLGYERAASRMATSYGQPAPAPQYEVADVMAPPPPQHRRLTSDERPVQYVDASGYRVRDYELPGSHTRYGNAPTSPTFQPVPTARYETMAPPPPREPTSPVYAPTRSYSVRPEEAVPLPTPTAYAPRQASVAPFQYARHEPSALPAAPPRAMSVVPGYEQPAAPPRAYSHAPPQPRYVDQYGREVFPSEVRQVPAPEYRYQ